MKFTVDSVLSGFSETKEKKSRYLLLGHKTRQCCSKMFDNLCTPLLLHRVLPVVFILQMFSCTVFGMFVVLPYLYGGYAEMILLSQQLLGAFMFMEILVNWLCIRCVDCSYKPEVFEIRTLQNKELHYLDESVRNRKQTIGVSPLNGQEKPGVLYYPYWSWTPCISCSIQERPPRCHHCPLCKACILKRDHHCYFAGRCIGSRNLRHFVVFLFWSIYALVYSLVHGFAYYFFVIYYESMLIDFVPFMVFIRRALGYDIKLFYGFLNIMFYALLYMTFICSQHFLQMVCQIPEGRTSFEIQTKIHIKDNRHSIIQNIRAVFGDYFLLNFLLPVHLWFPEDEDPLYWPTISGTKNNAYIKIGYRENNS